MGRPRHTRRLACPRAAPSRAPRPRPGAFAISRHGSPARRLYAPRHPTVPPRTPPRTPPARWRRPRHCWPARTSRAHSHPLDTAGRARVPRRLPMLCDRLPPGAAAGQRARARPGAHSRHHQPSCLPRSRHLPCSASHSAAPLHPAAGPRHTSASLTPRPQTSPPGHLPPTFSAPPSTSSQGTALLAAAVRARLTASSHTLHSRTPHPTPIPGARQSRH